MILQILFTEIPEIIKNQTGKNLNVQFFMVDAKTVQVVYIMEVTIPFPGKQSKSFDVKVYIEKFANDSLYATYTGGTGIDMMIAGALKAIPQLQSIGFVELFEKSQMIVHLRHKALKQIDIQDTSFCSEGAVVSFGLK